MSALAGALSIGVRALMAQQAALETTTSNIANVNTEGYVRRRPLLDEQEPVTYASSLQLGTGVEFSGTQSIRDRVLELQIVRATSDLESESAFASSLQPIENQFNNNAGGISGAMNEFFNSLTALTSTPQEMPARQRVLSAAEDLASSFRDTSDALVQSRQQIDLSVVATVDQINELSRRIAELNGNVSKCEMLGKDTGAYEDRRTELLKSMASLVGISVAQGDDGITVTTGNGTPLVVGIHSYSLSTTVGGASALHQVQDASGDITTTLAGGRLGGLLRARDAALPELQSKLDSLAYNVANAINDAHKLGTDLTGASGQELFAVPTDEAGAAAQLKVALTDPSQIAASSDGQPGSSGNVHNLLAVSSSPSVAGQTPLDAYSSIVFRVGSVISSAQDEADAAEVSLNLLQDQRGALSGVSLDEEAANLIRYQRAYQAAARVISVIDDLTETAINLGRN